MKSVMIYADGACSGNPGPGGYGAILEYNGNRRELSAGYRHTTNNRMELLGVIRALESLEEPCEITIVSDSQYVINGLEQGWAAKWKRNGWMRNKKDKALNPDLWGRLLELVARHNVTYRWVRGHSGHPENKLCDELARRAIGESGVWIEKDVL